MPKKMFTAILPRISLYTWYNKILTRPISTRSTHVTSKKPILNRKIIDVKVLNSAFSLGEVCKKFHRFNGFFYIVHAQNGCTLHQRNHIQCGSSVQCMFR